MPDQDRFELQSFLDPLVIAFALPEDDGRIQFVDEHDEVLVLGIKPPLSEILRGLASGFPFFTAMSLSFIIALVGKKFRCKSFTNTFTHICW
jgi:hypothetical protein